MLAGSQILQPPPASHAELCSRLESTLLDISDLALPARLLKDAEALLGDWFAAERSKVERSAAPALYRAIETLSRLTSIRRTLIGLAKALMEPPRPPAPKPEHNKPAQATPASSAPTLASPNATAPTPDAPASSSFVVPPSGGPGDCEEPTVCGTAPANPAATQSIPSISSTQSTSSTPATQPANRFKISLTGALSPEPSPRSALRPPHLSGPQDPTQQPKRGPLKRSSAEVVRQIRSCPRLASLSTKLLERNIFAIVRLKAAMAYVRPVPKPGQPTPPGATLRQSLMAMGFSFHPAPPSATPSTTCSAATVPSTADPPDSG